VKPGDFAHPALTLVLPCDDSLKMSMPANITVLLDQWREGDPEAFERLVPAAYDHLHAIAEGYIRGERREHTLQATALVHELFLRLVNTQSVQYASREHFFTFAAKLMRRILVDYARKQQTQKRGAGAERVTLAPELAWVDAASPEMLDLNQALTELAEIDPDKVRTLEIRFFLGATSMETADLLGLSRSRVDRDVTFAVSWLHRRLSRARTEQNSDE
jgi:RNA polymerase sigma factor (TIGR02999 family)